MFFSQTNLYTLQWCVRGNALFCLLSFAMYSLFSLSPFEPAVIFQHFKPAVKVVEFYSAHFRMLF